MISRTLNVFIPESNDVVPVIKECGRMNTVNSCHHSTHTCFPPHLATSCSRSTFYKLHVNDRNTKTILDPGLVVGAQGRIERHYGKSSQRIVVTIDEQVSAGSG